jgi:hypothetical protein
VANQKKKNPGVIASERLMRLRVSAVMARLAAYMMACEENYSKLETTYASIIIYVKSFSSSYGQFYKWTFEFQ